ncbi:hypothetical protein [Dapis sp. BLCC M172]|uniref:hypothetical protein n=1 Tax=Dapis sp. BLCC M172 TaxID=2975281 RepID=UPI003CF80AA0
MKYRILLRITGFQFLDLSKFLSSCNEYSLIEEDGRYYLVHSSFELMNSLEQVYKWGQDNLENISGLAMLYFSGFPVLQPDVVCEIDETGKQTCEHNLKAHCNIVDPIRLLIDVEIQGKGQYLPFEYHVQDLLLLTKEDEQVKKVIHLLTSYEHDFINLYKIYDIIKDEVGGKKSKKIEGWVTREKFSVSDFTQTANHPDAIGYEARHGSNKQQPPKNPMSLSEAQNFIFNVIKKWLDWKIEQKGICD